MSREKKQGLNLKSGQVIVKVTCLSSRWYFAMMGSHKSMMAEARQSLQASAEKILPFTTRLLSGTAASEPGFNFCPF